MVNRNEYLGRLMVLESARAAVSTKLEAMHAIDLEPDGRTDYARPNSKSCSWTSTCR